MLSVLRFLLAETNCLIRGNLRGKGSFGLQAEGGVQSIMQRRHSTSLLASVQSGSRERRSLVFIWLSPFSVLEPSYGTLLPMLGVALPPSVGDLWKHFSKRVWFPCWVFQHCPGNA